MAYFYVIDGIHDIGKTALCKKIRKKLAIPMLDEGAQELIDIISNGDSIVHFPLDVYKIYEDSIWAAKVAQFLYYDDKYDDETIVIADRSHISAMAYSKVFLNDISFLRDYEQLSYIPTKFLSVLLLRPTEKFLKASRFENALRELDHYIWKYYKLLAPNTAIHEVFINDVRDNNKVARKMIKGLKQALRGV